MKELYNFPIPTDLRVLDELGKGGSEIVDDAEQRITKREVEHAVSKLKRGSINLVYSDNALKNITINKHQVRVCAHL